MIDLASALSYSFVLSPMIFVVMAMAGMIVAVRWRRSGLGIAFAALFVFFLLSLPFVAGNLLAALERELHYTPSEIKNAGAIVVLGGDVERFEAGDRTPRLGLLSLERIYFAAREYRLLHLPILVTGGMVGGSPLPLADMMADRLQDAFGVPVHWRETRAGTTYQNAEFSAGILKKAGISSVVLVTQPWHMPRAIWAFSKFGIHAIPMELPGGQAPKQYRSHYFRLSDFLPSASAVLDSFYAMHEILGLTYYRLVYG
jgi:uncharacterized SAM-binding protein YcdF (DUF218 family)